MAITYTNVTDGQNVSVWAGNLNSFGNAVKANIDSIEADVTALDLAKIEAADTGMIYTTTVTPVAASLITTYAKVKMTDSVALNKANGHITADMATGIATFVTAGVYNIHFAGAMTAGNGVFVTFNYNLNGSSVLANPPQFEGKGATPVAIANSMFVQVTAGSTIYIEAKSASSTTMTPSGCGISIEKTHY